MRREESLKLQGDIGNTSTPPRLPSAQLPAWQEHSAAGPLAAPTSMWTLRRGPALRGSTNVVKAASSEQNSSPPCGMSTRLCSGAARRSWITTSFTVAARCRRISRGPAVVRGGTHGARKGIMGYAGG